MLALVAVVVALIGIAAYKWSQSQYYVADDGDTVAVFQGVEADLPGISTHHVKESSDLRLADLPDYNQRQVRDGISANGMDDARGILSRLERLALCPDPATPAPSATPSPSATASPRRRRDAAADRERHPLQHPQQHAQQHPG